MHWRAIGKDGEIIARVEAEDEIEADNKICRIIRRGNRVRLRESWRATGVRCEYLLDGKWQSDQ